MNKLTPGRITLAIENMIAVHVHNTTANGFANPQAAIDARQRLLGALSEIVEPTTNKAEAAEPAFPPIDPRMTTKDGTLLSPGITLPLYIVNLPAYTTQPLTGTTNDDGSFTVARNEHRYHYRINDLYASHLRAWDAHKTYQANGGQAHTAPTFNTKDMQALKVGKLYALWQVIELTGEILKLNGRVDMAGNLFEIVGSEGEDIAPTFPISELYFWRVNLLKDQLAGESTSTAVEVDSENEPVSMMEGRA